MLIKMCVQGLLRCRRGWGHCRYRV
ncbi:MAG: hypothetical protein FD130_184, partial [Halothiobacillaceae bacterium]